MITTLNTSAHDLRAIPDGSVHAVMTSPPYYGLRSYAGEQVVEWPFVVYRLNEFTEPVAVEPMRCALGLEPSPVAYIGHLILCLREWRRVLRDDGCIFVNLGDSYAGSGGAGGDYSSGGLREGQPKWKSQFKAGDTVKPKDLLGIPWMFAFAARADGWYLRSEIIWAKPNPMPESVRDRPTKAHEQVFLLAKSSRYFWDADAVRENSVKGAAGSTFTNGKTGVNGLGRVSQNEREESAGRNIRTVWNIATRPYSGAHYAVFPPDLVEPMVLASTSARGCCSECGAPWERVVERTKGDNEAYDRPKRTAGMDSSTSTLSLSGNGSKEWAERGGKSITTGWRPTCDHTAEPVHCTVLDPFAGSGTTGRVAVKHRRAAILCDISGEYLEDHVPDRTTVQMRLGVVA